MTFSADEAMYILEHRPAVEFDQSPLRSEWRSTACPMCTGGPVVMPIFDSMIPRFTLWCPLCKHLWWGSIEGRWGWVYETSMFRGGHEEGRWPMLA